MRLLNGSPYHRQIQFPTPIKEIKTLQKILDLEITAFPPQSPITGIDLWIRPGRFRSIQPGLFAPGAPEIEKTEMLLARIGKIVGSGNIGSPEVEGSHCPDSFRINHFHAEPDSRKKRSGPHASAREKGTGKKIQLALRILRPPLNASVTIAQNQPVRLNAPGSGIREGISGKIVSAAGPWKNSGDWWSGHKWHREEWDLQLNDGTLCRAYRDLQKDLWFVDAIYD